MLLLNSLCRRTSGLLIAIALLVSLGSAPTLAQTAAATPTVSDHSGGFLGLDRYDEKEDRGLFSRPNQKRLDVLVIAGVLGTALWEGTDTRLGRTTWQALDAMLTTAATTEVMKNVFSRPRPAQNPDASTWFAGKGHKSFPSGETAMVNRVRDAVHPRPARGTPCGLGPARAAALHGRGTHGLAGALADRRARRRGRGCGDGAQAHRREQPLVLTLTGDGVFVGWKTKF